MEEESGQVGPVVSKFRDPPQEFLEGSDDEFMGDNMVNLEPPYRGLDSVGNSKLVTPK